MAWKTYEQIMRETQNAQRIIDWEKTDKNYDNYKNLRLRWVNSNSVISKTIWVSPRTVIRYWKRWKNELLQKINNTDKEFEVQKILEQIDTIYSQCWNAILKDNLVWKDKISAISSTLQPLKLKAEILWLDKWNFSFTNNGNNANLYDPIMNKDLCDYFNEKIEEYNIDVVEMTWIKPI